MVLTRFFSSFCVAAPYGTPFNGFMGTGMAWPVKVFEARQIELIKVADQKVRKTAKVPISPRRNELASA
jgi:hypothetical protein